MSVEITYIRLSETELKQGFAISDSDAFYDWLHNLPSYTLGWESETIFRVLADHETLYILYNLYDTEIQHSSGFIAELMSMAQVQLVNEAFNQADLNPEHEFWEDLEEYTSMLSELKKLFNEAVQNQQLVMTYWL